MILSKMVHNFNILTHFHTKLYITLKHIKQGIKWFNRLDKSRTVIYISQWDSVQGISLPHGTTVLATIGCTDNLHELFSLHC